MFVNSGSEAKKKKRFEPWVFPRKSPGKVNVRNMFCIVIELMILRTIELHDYQFKDQIFRQRKGGAIGLDLTGEVAEVYNPWWDEQLLAKMRDNGLVAVVYKRINDINFIVDNTEHTGEQFLIDTSEGDTVDKVKRLTEDIAEFIKVTADARTKHEDKKLPILDIRVWIGPDQEGKQKVLYEHYMKDRLMETR